MLKIVKRNEPSFSHVVKEAIKHELFVKHYTFESMLKDYDDYIKKLSIFYDEEPIGLGMIWQYPEGTFRDKNEEHIGCYVKPEYRRKGVGSKIIKSMGGIKDRLWRPGETQDSGLFWLANEV